MLGRAPLCFQELLSAHQERRESAPRPGFLWAAREASGRPGLWMDACSQSPQPRLAVARVSMTTSAQWFLLTFSLTHRLLCCHIHAPCPSVSLPPFVEFS